MTSKTPRILIAGTHSGVGKTTLATGIMSALSQRGLEVQGYKVGPDYIDPSYHTLATGRPSRNLDRWLLGDRLVHVFEKNSTGRWAVIEGVMGLFDGMSGTPGFGSSADVAKLLDAPVVLIVDAANMSRSVAALVHGFRTFDPGLKMAGVILNRIKSPAQEVLLRDALAEIGVPVLGALPKEEAIRLPERHLGLVPSQEKSSHVDFFSDLNRVIATYIDLDRIIDIMEGTAEPEIRELTQSDGLGKGEPAVNAVPNREMTANPPFRLGVAKDEAFTFYYQDALEEAEGLGFELIPFSPLRDQELPPDLDGIFIGGGFPELHLHDLSRNQSFLESLRRFAQSGKTIYGECGGYMYLGESIADFEGQVFPLAGLIPIKATMTKRLQGLGYREGVLRQDSFLGPAGTTVHGHEFHYSQVSYDLTDGPETVQAYELHKGGKLQKLDGFAKGSILASYLHINFAGQPELLRHWVEHIRRRGERS